MDQVVKALRALGPDNLFDLLRADVTVSESAHDAVAAKGLQGESWIVGHAQARNEFTTQVLGHATEGGVFATEERIHILRRTEDAVGAAGFSAVTGAR